jgi:hypothetical protein
LLLVVVLGAGVHNSRALVSDASGLGFLYWREARRAVEMGRIAMMAMMAQSKEVPFEEYMIAKKARLAKWSDWN